MADAVDQLAVQFVGRYVTGRPLLGGAAQGGYLRRAAWRVGVPVAVCVGGAAYAAHPILTAAAVVLVCARAVRAGYRWWRTRRFRRVYVRPTVAALRSALGDAPPRLRVDPDLGDLVARLARPMSPAERRMREWYGQYVEPVLRWAPNQIQLGVWAVQRAARPATSRLEYLRRPRPDGGPRIQLSASVPFLTTEQREYVSAVVTAKIPVADLVERWDQVGSTVTATWTVRRRPPGSVGYADLDARIGQLAEWEYFLGLGVGGRPVKVSLKEDSPHICVSAASGAGKSVLAAAIGLQVLARGGMVVILDLKGSHRWALGLPGVDYCVTPEQMHAALLRLGTLANERNTLALHEEEGWDPGPRVLVVAEELNATFSMLRDYWADVREKGQPKTSPAIKAFRHLLFMGRSAKVNVLAVAQMLTANTVGGPEARENFAIRCLARYTRNAWQMLVPEAAMPRASRTIGRWQIVVGGTATECQVVYLTPAEVRLFLAKRGHVSTPAETPLIGADQDLSQRLRQDAPPVADPVAMLLSLRDATERGVLPWRYHAARRRLLRARSVGAACPAAVRRDGTTDLYRMGDLVEWAERELALSGGQR